MYGGSISAFSKWGTTPRARAGSVKDCLSLLLGNGCRAFSALVPSGFLPLEKALDVMNFFVGVFCIGKIQGGQDCAFQI
jgi:hypothetical protein